MRNSSSSDVTVALRSLREAYVTAICRRLISHSIYADEVIELAREMPALNVVRVMKRRYWIAYLWNRTRRALRRRFRVT
jgi:hypothetical protein